MVYTVDETFPTNCFSGVKLRRRIHITMCTYFGTFRFNIILWTSIFLQDAQAIRKPFQVVEKCPFNESEWKERAAHMTCNGSESYHCLQTESGDSLREQCIDASLFTSGFCPIFTKEGYLQWSPCEDTACPTSSYRSDEVYQYQICYRRTDNPKGENTEQGSNDSNSVTGWTIISVAVLFVLVLLLVIFYKRNQFGFKDKVQQQYTYLRNFFQCTDRTDKDLEDDASWHSDALWQPADDDWNSLRLNSPEPELPVYARPRKEKPMKDEDVRNGCDVLETNDFVYVVGLLGNSVSTVGKEIACKHAQKNKMSVVYLNYLDISTDFRFYDNTVYFVDGWFGLWNDNPCEKESVKERFELIFQVRNKAEEIKFVVGLSSEIRKTYAEFFKENGVLFSPSETILLDRSSKKKMENVKTRLDAIKKKCSTAECQCHKLELKHISDDKTLGPHLIMNLVSLDHSLATVLIDETQTPLDHLTEHFRSLYKKDEQLFNGILYLVLNGVYDEEEFSSLNVGLFTITRENMTNEKLRAYTKRIQLKSSERQKSKLAPTWSSLILGSSKERNIVHVFWHNLLYICAFRACYYLFPKMVILHCNLDAILQLVRPIGQGGHFTVEADVNHIALFYEKRIRGVKSLEFSVGEHPLVVKYGREHVGNN